MLTKRLSMYTFLNGLKIKFLKQENQKVNDFKSLIVRLLSFLSSNTKTASTKETVQRARL